MDFLTQEPGSFASVGQWLTEASKGPLHEFWSARVLVFLLVAARLAGLSFCLPVLFRGAHWVLRAGVVLSLALVLWPGVSSQAVPAGSWGESAGLVVMEFVLGASMSLAASLVLSAVRLSAELIDQQLGLTMTEGLALGERGGAGVGSLVLRTLAILVFLETGGHLMVVRACAESFQVIPPGVADLAPGLEVVLMELVQQSFVLALRLAAPVWGATALVSLAWGMAGRMVPALGNLFSVAPWRAGLGLLALSFALPVVAEVVAEAVPSNLARVVAESALPRDRTASPREPHGR